MVGLREFLARHAEVKQVLCPRCGSEYLLHYTDAYVLRTPMLNDEGELELIDDRTNEYDDSFIECAECGHRPEEEELLGILSEEKQS